MLSVPIQIRKNTFWLSPSRTVFWEEKKLLILSDLHLGKTGHFRKSGIAVPQRVFKEDMYRFLHELQIYKPKQVVIVGDLFHSIQNKENDLFIKWRNDFSGTPITLVKGNHDILSDEWYHEAGITVAATKLQLAGFAFQHEIEQAMAPDTEFSFTGHIHPGVQIKGLAKQSLTFPCFYFNKDCCILPAFGHFTGFLKIKPKKNDRVFAIVENTIVPL
jgi:DNA ligase-associated metallophosphoesterase